LNGGKLDAPDRLEKWGLPMPELQNKPQAQTLAELRFETVRQP
jgi:hypothetical protein